MRIEPERVEPDGRFRFLPEPRAGAQPDLALALGGGAAWGVAHLGFVEALRADGLRADRMAGTSAGAIVGAALAAGYRAEDVEALLRAAGESPGGGPFRGWFPTERAWPPDPLAPRNARGRYAVGRDGARLRGYGVFPDGPVLTALANHLARADALCEDDLDRLAFPFRAVATDLDRGEAYAPRRGSPIALVRASIGLPVFRPLELDGRALVDGGAVEHVPVPTARALGPDGGGGVVFGVAVTRDGSLLDPPSRRWTVRRVTGRYDAVAVADQRRRLLDGADLAIRIAVGDVPLGSFDGHLEELLAAGRAAWEERRLEAFRLLEARAGGPSWELRAWEIAPDARPDVARPALAAVRAALERSGDPARASRLRLEAALVRAIETLDLATARIDLDPARGLAVLHAEPEPTVRRLDWTVDPALAPRWGEPPAAGRSRRETLRAIERRLHALRRDGLLFAGIRSVGWDAATGTLAVDVEGGRLVALERAEDAPALDVPARGADPADLRVLQERLDRESERGRLVAPRILDAERAGNGYAVRVRSEPPLGWEIVWDTGWADDLGLTGFLGYRRAHLAGDRSWGVDVRAAGAREGIWVDAVSGPLDRDGWAPRVRLEYARPDLLLYAPDGGRDGSLRFHAGALGAAARFEGPRAGAVEVGVEARRVGSDGLLASASDGTAPDGTAYGLRLRGRGDLPGVPGTRRPGLGWSFDAGLPLAGEERAAWGRVDLAARFPLGAARRWTATGHLRVALAERGTPLPLDRWSDPGAWWLAPPLRPDQGLARGTTRFAAVLTRRVGRPLGIPLQVGGSAAWWKLDAERLQPALDGEGAGASVFVELLALRLGTISAGVSAGDADGDRYWLLVTPTRPR